MKRYCEGDGASFRQLYALVAPRLLAFLRRRMDERAAAEDVLQQTFLKLHGARRSYVEGEDQIPWLYAIARRTCVDELRRRSRACVRVALRDDGEAPEAEATFSGASAANDDSEPYVEAEHTAALEALARLPDDHRTALVLTKLQGLSMSAAAAIVGTTEGALKVRAHRGYVRLRAILGEQELFAERLAGTGPHSQRGYTSRDACSA
jgi:RNA polymerase sigma-70 factor (ECF subfamily)